MEVYGRFRGTSFVDECDARVACSATLLRRCRRNRTRESSDSLKKDSNTMLIRYCDYHPKSGPVTVPKFHFITLELSPCDNYRPVTTLWPCPEVVTISDKHCSDKYPK